MKTHSMFRAPVALLAVAVLAISAFGGVALAKSGGSSASAQGNIVEVAAGSDQFDTLVSLVEKAGLAETLSTGGDFTVFAPTDGAFAKVPKKKLNALASNPGKLKAVLLYHVAKGELRANKVMKRTSIKTLNGASVRVKVTDGVVKINNARVVKANIDASNGVIHAINRVLMP